MALTRNFLKSMGLTDEQVSAIIEGHNDTVEGLKKEIEAAKGKAEASDAIAKERDGYKARVAELEKTSGDAAKVQADYDAYKAKVEAERLSERKGAALDAALRKAGVARDSFRAQLRKSWNLDEIELDEGGAVKDEDKLLTSIKDNYKDFISATDTEGIPPVTPPTGGGAQPTLAAQIAAAYQREHYGVRKENE